MLVASPFFSILVLISAHQSSAMDWSKRFPTDQLQQVFNMSNIFITVFPFIVLILFTLYFCSKGVGGGGT